MDDDDLDSLEPTGPSTPLPMLRQKSPRAPREEGDFCFCLEKISCDIGNIRLRCRCLVHFECIVALLDSWSKDTGFINEWGFEVREMLFNF